MTMPKPDCQHPHCINFPGGVESTPMSTHNTGIAAQIQALKQAEKRRKAVLRMVEKGKTFEEIGEVLGVSRQRAHAIWKRATQG